MENVVPLHNNKQVQDNKHPLIPNKVSVSTMNKKPNTSIQMIADFEGDLSALMNTEAPEELPVLATRNMVLFPGVLVPILIGRKASMNLAKKLSKSPQDNICAVFCQKNSDVDVPATNELHDIGVYDEDY